MGRTNTVAVCIPSIPRRVDLLGEALAGVLRQTRLPDEIHVVIDHEGMGAAHTRNRAWRAATTDFVLFLDDDDLLYPEHIETLLSYSSNADLVYPWFDLKEGADPLFVTHNGRLVTPYGLPFDEESAQHLRETGNFIPVTCMVRRQLLEDVGGFPQPSTPEWPHSTCEDWGCWQRLLNAGGRFVHAPHRTWRWRWHGGNTSGRPWK